MATTWEELQVTCLQKMFSIDGDVLVVDSNTQPYIKSMPPVEVLEELSNLYGLTINELLSGRKLTAEEYREMAESNIRDTLQASTFELKEKQIFFKNKWRKDHISTFIACSVAWIVLLVALIMQDIEIYLCVTIGNILAILYYVVLNNRMMAYVEDHIFGGKWNEYKNSLY